MSSWKTKPGNSERGWNDPPMFIYGSGGTNLGASRRNILSKRVAFPLNATTEYAPAYDQNQFYNSHQCANTYGYQYHSEPTTLIPGAPTPAHNVHLLPPSSYPQPPSYHGPMVVPTMPVIGPAPHVGPGFGAPYHHDQGFVQPIQPGHVATDPMSVLPVAATMDDSDLQVPNFADDEQMFHYCVTRLQRALNECRTTTEERLIGEMQKKLNVFSDMWKSGKISYVVKSTMARLATAVHRRRYSVANELHLILMMDHVSEVSKWLVGIKKLVQEVEKAPQQPTSPSVSCSFDDTIETNQDSRQVARDASGSFPAADVNPNCSDHLPIDLNSNLVQQLPEDFSGLCFDQAPPQESNGIDFKTPVQIDQYSPQIRHSPPTFDSELIAQCFNGHGELMMKFVNDDNGNEKTNENHLDGLDSRPLLLDDSDLPSPGPRTECEAAMTIFEQDQPPALCDIPLNGDEALPRVDGEHAWVGDCNVNGN